MSKEPPPVASSGSSTGENTGRWTEDEHQLFLQGLEQHGKSWKKIACVVKSRNAVQVRTHAQKHFKKLAKSGQQGNVPSETRAEGDTDRTQRKRKAVPSGDVPSGDRDPSSMPPPQQAAPSISSIAIAPSYSTAHGTISDSPVLEDPM